MMVTAHHPASPLRDAACALQALPLFHDLAPDALAALAHTARPLWYGRGQVLTPADELPPPLYLIAHGSVRLYRGLASGQELTLATLAVNDPFTLLPGDQAMALSDATHVYRIPRDTLMQILATHPQVAAVLVDVLSRHLAAAYERIEDVALGKITTRLARLLAREASAHEGQTIMLTHDELAQRIGARQEDVTKALRHLREQGSIVSQPRQHGIEVPNPSLLAAL